MSPEQGDAPVAGRYLPSPYQRRLWSIGSVGTDFSVTAELVVEGCADPGRLRDAMAAVVARHGALRTRLVPLREYPFLVQEVASDGPGVLGVDHEQLGGGRHRLMLSAPACVLDPPSVRVLAGELAGVLGGLPPEPDPVQFVEYSDWRNDVLQEGAAQRAGAVAPALPAQSVHAVSRELDATLRHRLERLREGHGVPSEDLWLAVWAIRRWLVDAEDVTTSVAVDGRSEDPSLHALVGRAVHHVPVAVELDRAAPFGVALDHVRRARDAAVLRGEATTVAPGAGFEVLVSPERFEAGGVRVLLDGVATRTEPFGRRLLADPRSGRLTLELAAVHGPRVAVERALDGLLVLAAAALEHPDTPLERLPLVGEQESRWLADLARGRRWPVERTLTEMVVAAAGVHGQRTAVRDGRHALTYIELVQHAGRIGQALRAAGVSPGDAVLVIPDRTAWSAVAVLGVLWAGGVYVPTDEDVPVDRLTRVVEVSGARVVLAAPRVEVPASLARLDPATASAGPGIAPVDRSPADPVYMLFTSGSTGRPKGVVVSGRGLANYVGWAAEYYGMGPGGEGVVSSPFGFDLSVTTWLAPLTVGGTVVVAQTTTPLDLVAVLAAAPEGVLLKLTPRHLDALSRGGAEELRRVTVVVVGGEPLTRGTVERWRAVCPGCRVVNEYGPTETVVGSSYHEVPERLDPGEDVPIGAPVDNTGLYVLDELLRPVPAGMTGELHVSGAGVSYGYRGSPAETAQRFLPDPFAGDGSRMYRTGDLVRRAHDGVLTYVGRIDDQLKIRGYRVEPGEVESVLAGVPGVRAVAVMPSGHALVAFVVGDGDDAVDEGRLLAVAARSLPPYMVPGRVVVVPDLPLTVNGKVDRKALDQRARSTLDAGEHPASELEALVAGVWQEVLERERVGVDVSFFEAGGDSLLAVEVMRRLQDLLRRPLRVVTLFEHPTVRRLALHLAGTGDGGAGTPGGASGPDPLRAGAERAAKRARARARGGSA